MDSAIEAGGVTVIRGKVTALDDVSFTAKRGEIVGLLGPSGAGKTTLMRAMVGVQKITKGTLKVTGLPAGSRALRSEIGYVTQDAAVYPDLTVRQNLKYFATLARASKADVDKVIGDVRLDGQANQLVETLSGGQKTRVSLAVALLGSPDLLVLDEPTVGLDPLLRQELWKLFRELAASGKTLIVSSHVMDEADHCDTLLLLRDGKLVWNGTKATLLTATKQATTEAAFIVQVGGTV